MSLRSRLLAAFAALAIVPLLAVGVFDYWRTVDAVEALMAQQTRALATRAAGEIAARFRDVEANAALLAENAEARALLSRHLTAGAQPADDGAQRTALLRFLDEAWPVAGRHVLWASWRSPYDVELLSMGDRPPASEVPVRPLAWPVSDDRGQVIGRLEVAARLDSLLGDDVVRGHFGREGLSAVIDDERQLVLASDIDEAVASERVRGVRAVATAATARAARDAGADHSSADGVVAIEAQVGDSTWIGTRVPIAGTGLSVLSLASRNELSAPFTAIRDSNFMAVGGLTALVASLFVLLLWRGTAPLAALTVAADAVATGNLAPPLPPAGDDEAGRLARAFDYMLARIRGMLDEIDRARRMAVIGEFASQISHEIRNPLTGLKLNLQKLDRAVVAGRIPDELRRPVEITKLEVDRLDRVVRGVLQLGQPAPGPRVPFQLGDAVQRAVDAMRPDLERRGITIEERRDGDTAVVSGNAERVQALVVNLLLNAAEAMPDGGRVVLRTEREATDAVSMRVEDDGPGIPAADRERIFQPFYSTKANGTGLGLALAQRVVEEHHGMIVAEAAREAAGAALVVTLPIAKTPA